MRSSFHLMASVLAIMVPTGTIAGAIDARATLEVETQAEDYGWFEGRFSRDQSKIAVWQQVVTLAKERAMSRTVQLKTELSRQGVAAAVLPVQCWGDAACLKVFVAEEEASGFTDWSDFQSALSEARPFFLGYRRAADLVERLADDGSQLSPYMLSLRRALDQLFRELFDTSVISTEAPPSKQGRTALALLAASQENRLATSNDRFLAKLVEAKGWPKRSVVGDDASRAALSILQHSPNIVFQYKMLRLIMPIISQREIDREAAAYLYDRVTFNMTAQQKYGTQYTCVNGFHVALTLENPSMVDKYRAAVGLNRLQSYLDNAPGQCP